MEGMGSSKHSASALHKVHTQSEHDIPLTSLESLAFAAFAGIPTPLIVLSGNTKRIVLANDAVVELLEYIQTSTEGPTSGTTNNVPLNVNGRTLPEAGIAISQNDSDVWIGWDRLLDGLVPSPFNVILQDGTSRPRSQTQKRVEKIKPAQVDIILCEQRECVARSDMGNLSNADGYHPHNTAVYSKGRRLSGRMIITPFVLSGSYYYTMALVESSSSTTSRLEKQASELVAEEAREAQTTGKQFESFVTVLKDNLPNKPVYSEPVITSDIHSLKPEGESSQYDTQLTILQKITIMKNALLDTMELPVFVTWLDGSITLPNKAALAEACEVIPTSNDIGFMDSKWLSKYKVYDKTFSRELDVAEYPMSILCRSRRNLEAVRVGLVNREGEKRIYDCSGRGILDDDGEWVAGLLWLKDVTDVQKRLDTAIRNDDERFKVICNHMPQLIWTTTPDGYHDWYSDRWYEYTGTSAHESAGEGWRNPFHPDDLLIANKRWAHSLKTGEPYNVEYRCRRYDGVWNWMLGSALPLRDPDGAIRRWIGSCTLIEEQVQARVSTRKTKEQLQRVMNHAAITLWQVDNTQRLTLLEGRAIQTSGVHNKELIGKHLTEAFPSQTNFTSPVQRVLNGEKEVISEVLINDRFYKTSYLPLYYDPGSEFSSITSGNSKNSFVDGVIGVSMDITDKKNQEHELAEKAEENVRLLAQESAAKEASRLKSQFLANMSHEIRTPIAGVIGMSEILLDSTLNAEQQEYAENIQRSANALLTVINDILDFSKVESGKLDIEEVQFSLSLVISDVIRMLVFDADKKHISFLTNIQAPICNDLQVMGDPGRVRQILTNLLTNSIKFTSQGYVRLTAKIIEEVKATPGGERKTGDNSADDTSLDIYSVAYFEVEDSGIGIPEDVRKRLFQPFGQADSSTARKFGGSGLGLAICKNLVELMGGTIDLQSEFGKGTKAFFKIPFRMPSPEAMNSVTDENAIADGISDRLQHDASVSWRGSEASEHSPQIDVLNMNVVEHHGQSPTTKSGSRSRTSSIHSQPGDVRVNRISIDNGDSSFSPVIPNQIMSRNNNSPDMKSLLPTDTRPQYHVLVVEDNHINQQIAMKIVKKLGFTVSAVWNGKEALEYLLEANIKVPQSSGHVPTSQADYSAAIQRHLHNKLQNEEDPKPIPQSKDQSGEIKVTGKIIPDVCLMDVHMPVMDGYECTRNIRLLPEPLRDVPIIGLTASAIKGDREKCKEAGMNDYLAKPVRSVLLEKMLVKWLSNSAGNAKKMNGQTPPLENVRARLGLRLQDSTPSNMLREKRSSMDNGSDADEKRLSVQEQTDLAAKMGIQTETPDQEDLAGTP